MSGEEGKVKEERGGRRVFIITWMIIIFIYLNYINGLFDTEVLLCSDLQ